jgi:hypothetical protein
LNREFRGRPVTTEFGRQLAANFGVGPRLSQSRERRPDRGDCSTPVALLQRSHQNFLGLLSKPVGSFFPDANVFQQCSVSLPHVGSSRLRDGGRQVRAVASNRRFRSSEPSRYGPQRCPGKHRLFDFKAPRIATDGAGLGHEYIVS